MELRDAFDRRFSYLRLSVTDQCNFRCAYCLPNGYRPEPEQAGPLSVEEIRRLVTAFARLGVEKVRLTGGEPTVRRDLLDLVSTVAAVPGIRRVGLTTNGYSLAKLAAPLRQAGLGFINVSVDSLDPDRFREVTGRPMLEQVLAGVEAALAAGFPSVKVNAVLMKGLDHDELERFLTWTRKLPIAVRFIELMPAGCEPDFYQRHHLPIGWVKEELKRRGWEPVSRGPSDGPAVEMVHPDHQGRAGYIAFSEDGFCSTCNRLRVSARGDLKLCLFGERDEPLRPLLQGDVEALVQALRELVARKPDRHHVGEGCKANFKPLAAIGG